MTLSIILAFAHYLALGIGFFAILTRANTLKKLKDNTGLPEVFKADNFWGLAAGLWLITGLWRAFGGVEKGTDYYLHNMAFMIKLTLFILILIIEIKPMVTLIKWRMKYKKGEVIDFAQARPLKLLSHIQLGLLSIMVLFATMMARGILNLSE